LLLGIARSARCVKSQNWMSQSLEPRRIPPVRRIAT
jgi:hypothetical protein